MHPCLFIIYVTKLQVSLKVLKVVYYEIRNKIRGELKAARTSGNVFLRSSQFVTHVHTRLAYY